MTRLEAVVARLGGRPVGVVGDVMLDHFVIGRVDRISPEAPVPVVRFEREEYRLGGAANVAHNLHALGAQVHLIGLVGHDAAGEELRRELGQRGLDTHGLIVDSARPTTRKMRIVTSRNQQVARIDHEADLAPSPEMSSALTNAVHAMAQTQDALILSDYRKGVVTAGVIAAAVAAADPRRIPVLVDPKVPEADRYRGVSVLTPNHHEAELMTQTRIDSHDDAQRAARWLHDRTGSSVVITRGEHGMWVLDAGGSRLDEGALPAVAREVADVTGAGDTVIAALALALAAGASVMEAARLANIAAGLVVARFGPATVHPDELARAVAVQVF
jgi:rfaE bifunctional protein kinase chain/domain